jgi:hypothetical protein
MLRKTLLGTLAAGTGTGVAIFIHQILRQFAVIDSIRGGEASPPVMAAVFAVILITVGGADIIRALVRTATRS